MCVSYYKRRVGTMPDQQQAAATIKRLSFSQTYTYINHHEIFVFVIMDPLRFKLLPNSGKATGTTASLLDTN
jgi:hypothetical protein